MAQISATYSLADLVNNVPGAARVFERRGLDYCCGGATSLDDACATAGIESTSVVDELESLTPSERAAWLDLNTVELVDHIEQIHHAYLHEEMPRISALAEKVAGVHGGRHLELLEVRVVYEELRADLEPHMMKEEQVLFPAIREMATTVANSADPPTPHFATFANPISMMLIEHDHVGELMLRLRELTGGYRTPDDGCASYKALYEALAEIESDTHLHVHKENNTLFPNVQALEDSLTADT